jgi:hypothetical protein
MNMSIFSDSRSRRISLVLASVPAASSLEDLDLPLPQQAPLGVDLLSGQDVSLVHGLAEDRAGTGEEGHVADPERLVRNGALGFLLGLGDSADADSGCRPSTATAGDSEPQRNPTRRSTGIRAPARRRW